MRCQMESDPFHSFQFGSPGHYQMAKIESLMLVLQSVGSGVLKIVSQFSIEEEK